MKGLSMETVRYLTAELEIDPVEINASSANELLDTVLTYEGYGMSAGFSVRQWVKRIYGIDLEEVSGKIARRECGEVNT